MQTLFRCFLSSFSLDSPLWIQYYQEHIKRLFWDPSEAQHDREVSQTRAQGHRTLKNKGHQLMNSLLCDAFQIFRLENPEGLRRKCRTLAKWIGEAKHVVIFTGPGISTAAGINPSPRHESLPESRCYAVLAVWFSVIHSSL